MESAELMEHISIFCEQSKVKALLQEYMRRIILEQPEDPVSFLIDQIKDNPYSPAHAKCIDNRSEETKLMLLRKLFEPHAIAGIVDRAKILLGLQAKPSVLLEYFPMHAKDIIECTESIPAEEDNCSISWKAFSEATLLCLSKPGLGSK